MGIFLPISRRSFLSTRSVEATVLAGVGRLYQSLRQVDLESARGLRSLAVDSRGLRQGSHGYNQNRVQSYLDAMKEGRIPNDPAGAKLANDLLARMEGNNVKSFASFAKSERLYELIDLF